MRLKDFFDILLHLLVWFDDKTFCYYLIFFIEISVPASGEDVQESSSFSLTVNQMSERETGQVPRELISATIIQEPHIFDQIRNGSKDMEVKFKKQAVKPYIMFHAGQKIRDYRHSSCLNLIGKSVCPEGPYGPFTAQEAWNFTKEGKGLGFIDFESFQRFTRKRVTPSALGENRVSYIIDRSVWLYAFTSIRECPEMYWNDSVFNNNTGWLSHHNCTRGAARFGYKEREVKSLKRIRAGLGWRMVPRTSALGSAKCGAVSGTGCLPPVPKKPKHYGL